MSAGITTPPHGILLYVRKNGLRMCASVGVTRGDGREAPAALGSRFHSGARDHETTVDRSPVRITEDVGLVFGVAGREYDPSEDDVVTLPSITAKPNLQKDAAVPFGETYSDLKAPTNNGSRS